MDLKRIESHLRKIYKERKETGEHVEWYHRGRKNGFHYFAVTFLTPLPT